MKIQKGSTEFVAEQLIQEIHPGCFICCVGGAFRGREEGLLTTHTVTIDTCGQGQDVRVYEVFFYPDGHGGVVEVAATEGRHHTDVSWSFDFDIIKGDIHVTTTMGLPMDVRGPGT